MKSISLIGWCALSVTSVAVTLAGCGDDDSDGDADGVGGESAAAGAKTDLGGAPSIGGVPSTPGIAGEAGFGGYAGSGSPTAGIGGEGGEPPVGGASGAGGGADVAGGTGGVNESGAGGVSGASGAGGEGGASVAGAPGSGGEGGANVECEPPFERPDAPPEIAVAPSAGLVAAYAARGTQTYTCGLVTGTTTYGWSTTSVPSALLFDQTCGVAGVHFVGPRWQQNDGSTLFGVRQQSAPSSTPDSILQLLLSATLESGSGVFSNVTAIQRLDTVGGIAPSSGCDVNTAGATVAVPYTANYYFYSGENIIPGL